MGKKKLALKPVQRGFATTSIPAKKVKADPASPVPDAAPLKSADSVDATTPAESTTFARKNEKTGKPCAPDDSWDNDEAVSTAAYQALIERLQEKGDKEVARIMKSIDFDKRLGLTFPHLGVNQRIRDAALRLAVEGDSGTDVKPLEPAPTGLMEDKILLRLFIAYHVLRALVFSEARVGECILSGLKAGEGWEEALDWMWLHLTDEEMKQLSSKDEREGVETADAPLVDVTPPPRQCTPPLENAGALSTAKTTAQKEEEEAPRESTVTTSLFQSLDQTPSESSEEEFDSDADLDLGRVNENWAKLKVELESLKALSGASKGKGKKNKSGPQLETPEMHKVRTKMTKLEKDYMFSRKDADALFKVLKSKRDIMLVETKLRQSSLNSNGASIPSVNVLSSLPATPVSATATETPPRDSLRFASDDDAEDGEDDNMFGNMLDDPAPVDEMVPSNNTVVAVRSMPIPKQFSFTGNTPKSILQGAVRKLPQPPAVSFAKLSANARIARAGLEIRWSPEKRRVWRMEDLACDSHEEAENYVSTLALNALVATGDIHCNWRALPPAYRELWEELENERTAEEMRVKRKIWQTVKGFADQKLAMRGGASERAAATLGDAVSAVVAPSAAPSVAPASHSVDLQNAFERRVETPAYQRMLKARNTLPIASFKDEILRTLDHSQVLVFSGETGCGKSTQLPSYILENELSHGRPCKIIVTEPRRISAISLAQRVSVELGDAPGTMGSRSSLVGYSIRLESKISSNTRLTFMTNGIALRMLESGSASGPSRTAAFDEVTHIVVDEVHERSIESDFLLIVLRELLNVRKDIKVVLMSATVDADKISAYFNGCPSMTVPGRTFPVNVNYLEDAVETCGWHIDESSPYAIWDRNKKTNAKQLQWTESVAEDGDSSGDEQARSADPTKLQSSLYSARTVSTVNILDSRKIPYGLIVRLLERICFEDVDLSRYSAATLVFMPGLAEIRKLNDLLQSHPRFGASGDFVIYPLHSTISSEGQSAVFNVPPKGIRKIVISTNIAETGVTIPDITCVIDSGKQREMRFDEKRQLSKLVETYIARSNAKQRRGRAGRVQEGLAFHLFTKARHDVQLAEHPVPEMLRLSLQDLALRIKILKVKLGATIEEVLAKALDPPSSANIQRAVQSLVEVRALTPTEDITPMGRLLSKLPMEVHLGKILLLAALFKCLDPALTIVATLNSKSPFITPFGFEEQAKAAKKSFVVGNSDFLTIVNVFDSWRRAADNRNFIRTFCQRNYLSHTNLQQIEELRQQLLANLIDSGFVSASEDERKDIARARYSRGLNTNFARVPVELNVNANNTQVLEAALASGLYPKVLSMDATGGLRTLTNQQPVSFHPSSVNFKALRSEFDTSFLVYFTLMQSRKLYAWESGPVNDRALALLCGDLPEVKLAASSFQIDRRLRFRMDPRAALALKLIREQFVAVLALRMRQKPLSERQQEWFELGLRFLTTEEFAEEQRVIVQ